MTPARVEALLRPQVEYVAAGTSASLAGISWWLQAYYLFTPAIGRVAALFFAGHAAWRLQQAIRIGRFQRSLRHLEFYALKSRAIPRSTKWLFLGKGFAWDANHTKRLRDTRKRKYLPYLKPARVETIARELQQAWSHVPALSVVSRFLGSASRWNPWPPPALVGGAPELHGVGMWEGETDVTVPRSELVGHMVVIGSTRTGKTRLEEMLIEQDVAIGNTTIVFDPKGDAQLLRRVYGAAKRGGKLDRLYFLHLAFPELSARYNALGSFTRVTQIAQRLTAGLPGEGDSAAFKEFAWRVTHIIAKASLAMGERPDFKKIQRYVNDLDALVRRYLEHWLEKQGVCDWRRRVRQWETQLKHATNLRGAERERPRRTVALMRLVRECLTAHPEQHDPVVDSLLKLAETERAYLDKTTSNLGPLLEKLTTGKIAEILSPDYDDPNDPRPILDWGQVIRERGIVYVGLDALTDVTVAGAVGQAMFEDLTAKAGELYAYGKSDGFGHTSPTARTRPRTRISVHADELSAIANESVLNLLARAGGSDFELKLYSQSLHDLEWGLGDRARAHVAIDNLNTVVMMRVQSTETARFLTDKVPPVEIEKESEMFGYHDSAQPENAVEFTSAAHQRVEYQEVRPIEPGDVTRLPKGHAFVLTSGNRLYKVRIPLPEDDDDVPETIAAMAQSMMRSAPARVDWWVDNWFEDRYRASHPQPARNVGAGDDADHPRRSDAGAFDPVRAEIFEEETL